MTMTILRMFEDGQLNGSCQHSSQLTAKAYTVPDPEANMLPFLRDLNECFSLGADDQIPRLAATLLSERSATTRHFGGTDGYGLELLDVECWQA